jgi:hypothetical protein
LFSTEMDIIHTCRIYAWLHLTTEFAAGLPDGIFSSKKSPFWVNFGGSCNGRCMYISRPYDLFYDQLLYFMVIWYFFLFWYDAPRKIWQPWFAELLHCVALEKSRRLHKIFSQLRIYCCPRILSYLQHHRNAFELAEQSTFWLPDDIFTYLNSKFGYILEGLGMENVIFYWRFGIFYYQLGIHILHTYGHSVHSVGNLVYFSHFGMLCQE